MTPPCLSIIVTGRNDDFGGDFNGRFFRALRFNHERLTAAGVAHEFVFVEWSPLPDRPYLATLLERELRDLAESELRCYVVDSRYHEALSLNPRLRFQEFIAKNVGIRRAHGRLILTTNTDIYLGRGVITRLAEGLDAGVLYRAARHDLKDNSDLSWIDWDLLEDERNWEVVNRIKPPLYTNACGDFLLLDAESYGRLRGFNEVYRTAKIHIDGNFCVKAHSSGTPLVDIGFPVYHVGRGTLHAQVGAYRHRLHEAPWGDIRWNSEVVYENGDEWGLGRAPARPIGARTIALEFDWHAVGPMVDLRRIVAPSAGHT